MKYLVLGGDDTIGAYDREIIMKIDLQEHRRNGHPARAVFRQIKDPIGRLAYERIHEYDHLTEPLENLCARHQLEALPFATVDTCQRCAKEPPAAQEIEGAH